MFDLNEENQLYWFKRQTLEMGTMPINFELLGTLIGIALYNGIQVDLPLAPAIFKLLVGEKPNMSDLEAWQPSVAQSMKDILTHSDKEYFEAIYRTFSEDLTLFGATNTVDLKPNGRDIFVTPDNKEEYVRLYIEYEFET